MSTVTLPPLLTAEQLSAATREGGAEGISLPRVYELAREGRQMIHILDETEAGGIVSCR